jgi:hypothetical protein
MRTQLLRNLHSFARSEERKHCDLPLKRRDRAKIGAQEGFEGHD